MVDDEGRQAERTGRTLPKPVRERADAGAATGATREAAPPPRSEASGDDDGGFPQGWERYDACALLGVGGMGRVYKAWDPRLRRNVAIKFLSSRLAASSAQLLSEAQAQARVDHKHLCKVYEVGEIDGRAYIAMQLVDGKPLEDAAREMTIEDKVAVLRKVAEAVHAAHSHGLLHRDLKPKNIMIERTERGQWEPYVLDFGIAREEEQTQPNTGEVSGTPAYMSPEQVRGEPCDRRSDVYGLGATLYATITGRPPHEGRRRAVLDAVAQGVPAPRAPLRGVAEDLVTIVDKALEPARERRYASADALAEDLRRYLVGEPIAARRDSLVYRVRVRLRRSRALALAIAVSLVVVGTLGLVLLQARRDADRRVRTAQRFGQEAARLESFMRQAYMAPLHDTRPERRQVLARIATLESEAAALGGDAEAMAAYAIGRCYLSMHDWSRARTSLQRAYDAGYRAPEARYALGVALAAVYQQELAAARRLRDEDARARREAELAHTLREPALAHLAAAREVTMEVPAYAEGLIAFTEGRFDGALARGREAAAAAPWLYEVHELMGGVHVAVAAAALRKGDYELATRALDDARRAYEQALAMAPSDDRLQLAECERQALLLMLEQATGKSQRAHVEAAAEPCRRAYQANLDATGPLVLEASLLLDGAQILWTTRGEAPDELLARADARIGEALALSPGLPEALHLRGLGQSISAEAAIGGGGDPSAAFSRAVEAYSAAIAADPELVAAHLDLCIMYQTRGDWEFWVKHRDPRASLELAVASCERGRAIDPDDRRLNVALGSGWGRRGTWEAEHGIDPTGSFTHAEAALARVQAQNPRDARVLSNIGITLATRGYYALEHGRSGGTADLDRAEAVYERALALNGDNSDTLNNLGFVAWVRVRYLFAIGADAEPALRQGLAWLARAEVVNAKELNVYYNRASLHLEAARHAVAAGSDAGPALAALSGAARAYLVMRPDDPDVIGFLAESFVLEARQSWTRGGSPATGFAEAERLLATAEALGTPADAARLRIECWRAEWLLHGGHSAAAAIANARAAAQRLLDGREIIEPRTHLLLGELALIEALAAKDPVDRRAHVIRALAELAAAVAGNVFLDRAAAPLRARADALMR